MPNCVHILARLVYYQLLLFVNGMQPLHNYGSPVIMGQFNFNDIVSCFINNDYKITNSSLVSELIDCKNVLMLGSNLYSTNLCQNWDLNGYFNVIN